MLLIGLRMGGAKGASAVILTGNLAYGFLPMVLAFQRVVSIRRSTHGGEPADEDADEVDSDASAQDEDDAQSSLASSAAVDASS